jgi:hypothetical protein
MLFFYKYRDADAAQGADVNAILMPSVLLPPAWERLKGCVVIFFVFVTLLGTKRKSRLHGSSIRDAVATAGWSLTVFPFRFTALHFAVLYRHVHVVRTLLQLHANAEVRLSSGEAGIPWRI